MGGKSLDPIGSFISFCYLIIIMSISTDFDQAYRAFQARHNDPKIDILDFIATLEYESEIGSDDPSTDLFLDYIESQIATDPSWVQNYAS